MTNFHAMLIVILIWLTIILHSTGALPTAIDKAINDFHAHNTHISQIEKD